MRKILFRGKAKQGGEWVREDLIHVGEWVQGDLLQTNYSDGRKHWSIFEETPTALNVRVTPETVGQFIGVCDKNGTQIFEHDLVRTSEQGEVYEIAYIEHYARFAGRRPGVVFAVFDFEQCEVIGNVYDNPELLELLNERKERTPICVLSDEDDCVETPLFWQPRIIRGQPDYICPYCSASAGTTIPGPYCAKCGEPVDLQGTYAEHFEKDGADWKVRAKQTVENANGN